MTPSRYWFDLRPKLAARSHLLFLVAHSGAGPRVMGPLAQRLPPGWAAYGLSLPGRERRIDEPPEWDPGTVATSAAAEARALASGEPNRSLPITVAGQCTGAWLAHAILASAGPEFQHRCDRLFVFSQIPWHAPRPDITLPETSDAMWARLSETGNTPPEVLVDEEFRDALEPVIRADYRAAELFPAAIEPVRCPITVITGLRDRNFARLRPEEWAGYTTSLTVRQLDCGHLAMQELPEQSARALAERP